MKKPLLALVLMASIGSQVVSTPSQAAMIVAGGPVSVVSLIASITAGGLIGGGVFVTKEIIQKKLDVPAAHGLVFIGAGLLLLDQQTGMLRLQAIDAATAKKAELTEEELAAYNKDLPRFNLAIDETNAAIATRLKDSGRTEVPQEESDRILREALDDAQVSKPARVAAAKVLLYALIFGKK